MRIVAAAVCCALFALTLPGAQPLELSDPLLHRLSEEASAFRRLAPKIIGRETLEHKGRKAPPRLRWLSRKPAPGVAYRTTTLVSEYGFGYFQEAPDNLREFRQVVSVDGRARTEAAIRDPRQILAENMASDDDRLRRRLLEDFERFGQTGSATDFGQMLLLFERRALPDYEFSRKGDAELNSEDCHVIHWRQSSRGDALHVFSQRRLERIPMEGEIWFRASDGMPLRITMQAGLTEDGAPVTFSSETDYARSHYGLLLPAAVHLEKKSRSLVLIDNRSTYTDYQMFGADSSIRFEALELEDAPASSR